MWRESGLWEGWFGKWKKWVCTFPVGRKTEVANAYDNVEGRRKRFKNLDL